MIHVFPAFLGQRACCVLLCMKILTFCTKEQYIFLLMRLLTQKQCRIRDDVFYAINVSQNPTPEFAGFNEISDFGTPINSIYRKCKHICNKHSIITRNVNNNVPFKTYKFPECNCFPLNSIQNSHNPLFMVTTVVFHPPSENDLISITIILVTRAGQ